MKFFIIRKLKAGSILDRLGRVDATKERGFNVGDALHCPACNRPLSMLEWRPPYRIELECWGTQYGDVADISDDLVVSERFKKAFAEFGLGGLLDFEPVEIVKVLHRRGVPSGSLPQYFRARVARSATTIDQQASGYVWEDESKVCPECLFDTLKRYSRLIIQPGTWRGEDIFYPRGGNGPLVSERFRKVFLDSALVGLTFIPAEEDSYDFFPWEKHIVG